MGTSIIDGTVVEATLKRSRAGVSVFSTVQFLLTDGSSRTLKSVATTKAVGEELQRGGAGRFYLFTAMDMKGVHGVRRADGAAVYGFPGNNTIIFVILGVVNILWVALKVLADGEVPFLGVGLIILAVVGYVLMGRTQGEAKRQFESDADFARTPPPGPVSITV